MVTRSESAAATRRALLRAARELLNEGGPQKVTLREVGARAAVSRGAPYRHFADKESLLAAVGSESWDRITEHLGSLPSDPSHDGAQVLRSAMDTLLTIGRDEPEVYRVMFTVPSKNAEAAVAAASRAQTALLRIVAGVVGEQHAHLYGAVLLTSAHGIATMQASGHLSPQLWQTSPDAVTAVLTHLVAHRR